MQSCTSRPPAMPGRSGTSRGRPAAAYTSRTRARNAAGDGVRSDGGPHVSDHRTTPAAEVGCHPFTSDGTFPVPVPVPVPVPGPARPAAQPRPPWYLKDSRPSRRSARRGRCHAGGRNFWACSRETGSGTSRATSLAADIRLPRVDRTLGDHRDHLPQQRQRPRPAPRGDHHGRGQQSRFTIRTRMRADYGTLREDPRSSAGSPNRRG